MRSKNHFILRIQWYAIYRPQQIVDYLIIQMNKIPIFSDVQTPFLKVE